MLKHVKTPDFRENLHTLSLGSVGSGTSEKPSPGKGLYRPTSQLFNAAPLALKEPHGGGRSSAQSAPPPVRPAAAGQMTGRSLHSLPSKAHLAVSSPEIFHLTMTSSKRRFHATNRRRLQHLPRMPCARVAALLTIANFQFAV